MHLSFSVSEKIYLKNPELSEVGRKIVKNSIDMIAELGFEQFTFKKLASKINTTEATVYRYFENKHRLLLYILNWYWSYLEYLLTIRTSTLSSSEEKLNAVLALLSYELPDSSGELDYNKKILHQIVVVESSKTYLVKDVQEMNQNDVFRPYKTLCAKFAEIILEHNSNYKFPNSLSSTLIEASHQQQFFAKYLPRLTNIVGEKEISSYTYSFLSDILFKSIDKKK